MVSSGEFGSIIKCPVVNEPFTYMLGSGMSVQMFGLAFLTVRNMGFSVLVQVSSTTAAWQS
jgi:hypothetical protein